MKSLQPGSPSLAASPSPDGKIDPIAPDTTVLGWSPAAPIAAVA